MNKKLLLISSLCVGILAAPLCSAEQTAPITEVKKGNGACSSPDEIRADLKNYFQTLNALYENLQVKITDSEQAIKLNFMLGSFLDQSLNRQPTSPQGRPKQARILVSH